MKEIEKTDGIPGIVMPEVKDEKILIQTKEETVPFTQDELKLAMLNSRMVEVKGTEEKEITIDPTVIDFDDKNKFDPRFANRKARRKFMQEVNSMRVNKKKVTLKNKNTGKRYKKIIVGIVKEQQKLVWDNMPKFDKQLSEQYSIGCGFIKGWRNAQPKYVKAGADVHI